MKIIENEIPSEVGTIRLDGNLNLTRDAGDDVHDLALADDVTIADDLTVSGDLVVTGNLTVTGNLSVAGTVTLPGVPTSDPAVADQVWADTLALKVSAGA